MTDKELKGKIIAEIERRIIAIPDNNNGGMARRTDKIEYQLLNDLLYFVNSLPGEPISNTWHDASEEPEHWPVLVIDPVEEGMVINQSTLAAGLFNEYNVTKWAYIDDLLHKQEKPVNEELEEASRNYADNEEYGDDVYFAIKAAFKAGAQWKEKRIPHWKKSDLSNTPWGINSDYLTCPNGYIIELKELLELPKES